MFGPQEYEQARDEPESTSFKPSPAFPVISSYSARVSAVSGSDELSYIGNNNAQADSLVHSAAEKRQNVSDKRRSDKRVECLAISVFKLSKDICATRTRETYWHRHALSGEESLSHHEDTGRDNTTTPHDKFTREDRWDSWYRDIWAGVTVCEAEVLLVVTLRW
ncbi:hypothetical protein BDN70DRAFT_881327 [Pholiota conissans]|uniref:Uncharacterized protein n=1 Tax=Pholiota conissans TaxID=109636 RepID=A0A9P5YX30_9AGAR|nr:hypothetical protein BDN70DRAFT_881327 [Pholiota conissans]